MKMRRTTRHLEDFVDNLCEFVRLDSGNATLNPRVFCFETLVREAVELFMPYAQHKGVLLTYDVRSRSDRTILGDEMRIRQVLLNLVKNAITHTDGGVVDITASISPTKLRVSVRDDGVGMEEEAVKAVLGEEIAPALPNREFGGGLGLGLTICQRLLKLMGGRLLLESAPGFGTIAGFELAFKLAAAKTPTEPPDSPYWE
jgi:protein-histidine pros-kinase